MARPDYYGNPAGLVDEIEVVRALYDAFERRDLDAMLAGFSENAELFLEGTARLAGRTEPYRGHDGLREYLADVDRLWEELVLHVEDYRAVPGSVIVMGHITGRRQGLDVQRAAVWTWKVADGLATSVKAADLGDL
ncbi:nuclear transport factor 2 family protein [Solirubrobacter sp. CPCC 204708]|uniref:Nuclear transport factor 2 family protein n=1 Tax=Solirubrobacter deserti TaxID=2282478 RepID=A0ABT4REU4_9ACTN|nr:nuclear transport factor 2 family protein [Solirubrobacter deserti]MBE2316132.1 nuclear transport factor 2 family protein [Solirubrobacter deserti]MDA0136881.1 nuclear transport factor 2 family protein [Solirubrobacter deserti]